MNGSTQKVDSVVPQPMALYDYTDESLKERAEMQLSKLDRVFRSNTVISTEDHTRRYRRQLEPQPYFTPALTAPDNKWVLS